MLANSALSTKLEDLDLAELGLTSKALRQLTKFTALQRLDLNSIMVKDEDLQTLSMCKSLNTLRLKHTKVTGATLSKLHNLKNLTHLVLSNTELHNCKGQLSQLSKLKLTSLELDSVGFTDSDLKELVALKRLESIQLKETAITPEGLNLLLELPKLKSLKFSENMVTSKDVEHFKNSDEQKFKVPINVEYKAKIERTLPQGTAIYFKQVLDKTD